MSLRQTQTPESILFYFGFLPAFVDVSLIDEMKVEIIIITVIFAIVIANLRYAWVVDRDRYFASSGYHRLIHEVFGRNDDGN